MRKAIRNFEGKYEVTSDGQVISLNYNNTGKEQVLKGRPDTKGYLGVVLHKNNKPCHRRIHRLVAETFIPNVDSKENINHINGNKLDNRIENLEWVSVSENLKHAFKIGLKSNKGEKNNSSKLKDSDIPKIFELHSQGYEIKQIALIYKVHHDTIRDVLNRKTWSHVEIKKPS